MRTTLPDLDASTGGAPTHRSRAPSQRGKRRARPAPGPGQFILPKPRRRALGMPENLPGIVGEFEIVIVPTSHRRRSGETHAKAKLRDILLQHGEDHLRLVLRLIRGTAPNREALWSEIFEALSDMLVSIPAWKDREPELCVALGTISLEKAREKAVSLRPWPVRSTLRVLLRSAWGVHVMGSFRLAMLDGGFAVRVARPEQAFVFTRT